MIISRVLKNSKGEVISSSGPSLTQEITNATTAVSEWVSAGMPLASSEVYAERLAICQACENWIEDARLGYGKCKICGCGKGKFKLATSRCPINKWGPVQPSP